MATWGNGKPVIALGSDIDGIPQSSQKPGVAYRDPLVEGAPGHGEGHNSGQAVNITAAIVLKKIMEREKIPGHDPHLAGRRRGAGRHQGVFHPRRAVQGRGRRAVHARRPQPVGVVGRRRRHRPRLGALQLQGRERARGRRAVARPSALDAVELMNVGWNYRREHLPLSQRSHYVINDGGDQPNVVPPTASVWYYFRQVTYPGIKEMWATGDQIAAGAAMMTDTTLLPTRVLGSAWPRHFNRAVARGDAGEHPEGRHARVERGRSDVRARRAEGARRERDRA